jgi:uncharacterized protein YndB with AHSA1/START domain
MTEANDVLVTRMIQAESAEVWRGFTHETLLRDWLSHAASANPRQGGHLFLGWRDGRTVSGAYEQLDPPRGLRFTWSESGLAAPSAVEVSCEREGEGTRLTLKHSGLAWVDPGGASRDWKAFWDEALENLASVVETGIDLRLARRPRLGIYMDELTPEAVQRTGAPVRQGILLEGTAEGSGARAAGLTKDDVLISLNGAPLTDTESIFPALVGLKAGDRPMVEYYRGAEKRSTPLELGNFPIPELPDNVEELAKRVRELYAEVLSAMRAQLEGLNEQEASTRPAENEWSAKELVAHFILMERDYQSWAADMLNDTPVDDYLEMRPNVQPRLAALVARLGSLPALFAELALAQEESAVMIAGLPDHFVRSRKHLYRRAAQWEIEVIPGHYFEEHKEQFQAVIQAGQAA